ncbi:hypothetical protein Poly30_51580 [Planctomycetes bacterium Poly30]|uniref:Uncharacterized protein n=2 Tax=Saltatorellus ferox TaxID=2528018 RepID=A0A518EZT5_9BACT|nr:hypothetical protein Poly30_51580 [Planctomycetes bacterium Poly30]
MELAEMWEQPLTSIDRQIIFDELDGRGYRTKSLPLPPPDLGPGDVSASDSEHEAPPSDEERARSDIGVGVAAALFVSSMTLLIAFVIGPLESGGLAEATSRTLQLISAAVFGLLAFGIYRRSRVAAGLALGLYALDRFLVLWELVEGRAVGAGGMVASFFILLGLVKGLRGTLLHHRIEKDVHPESL